MTNPLRLLFLTVCAAALLCAADATGVWKAVYTTPDGSERTSTFHLKADGDRLTGTIESQMGSTEIKNGKAHGDDVSFEVVRNFNGNEFTLKYAGKVEGDELKLKVTFNDENSFDIVGKRQKS